MRILSGVQPSGKLHLGNYFSMMKRMIHYQEKEELFCFIASLHALTTVTDSSVLEEGIRDALVDFLALGLDPDRCTFWVQSDVPEVTEFAWYLSTSITVPQLELGHSYKDKIANNVTASAGLFYYPVLMAADILAFGADKVPVGKDQKQHLEFTRDIARRFNNQYGEVLKEPSVEIAKEVATVPGTDNRKMSKSYGNAIYFFAPEKQLKKAVMSIVTDSAGLNDPKQTDGTPLFEIYSLFLDEDGKKELEDKYKTPGVGYGHIKQDLLKTILEHFGEAREKREQLLKDRNQIRDIALQGAAKARDALLPYLDAVRKATGYKYF